MTISTSIQFFLIAILLGFCMPVFAQENIQFIENKGQWNNNISYSTPLQFGDIYFEKDNWSFLLQSTTHSHTDEYHEEHTEETDENEIRGHFYKMIFQNATTENVLPLGNAATYYYNYFIGRDKTKWASKVPVYTSLLYKNIYPNTDIVVKENGSNLKYDIHIKPGGNPKNIEIQYSGIENPRIENGNFVYETSLANITELKPYAYQIINDKEVEIACEYSFNKKTNTLSFKINEKYNTNIELIIDPTLVFSRLTESTNSNFGFTATYDSIGRAYGGGIVFNSGGQYPTSVGAYDTSFNGGIIDIAISCYHQTTGAQIYGTYIGGNETELPNSMIVNNAGELVVLGTTSSSDFPVSTNAYDTTFIGGDTADYPNNGVHLYSGSDMVLFKLSNDGSTLNASTLFGGSENDGLNDDTIYQSSYNLSDLNFNYGDAFRGEVIIDSSDNIYVASSTNSNDFPIVNSTSVFQGAQDGVVLKFTTGLDSIIFSHYLGGNGNDGAYSMKIDHSGNLFVVGGTMSNNFPATNVYNGGVADGFLAKLDGSTGNIQNAIYIGTDSFDQVYLIDIDLNDNVYIVGQTLGNYPIVNATYGVPNTKQFIHKFSNDLSSTFYSTCFGSDSLKVEISPTALLVDICERVFVSGWGGFTNYNRNSTYTSFMLQNLPVTSDAVQPFYNNYGDFYFFVLDKNAAGIEYATFFGGTAQEHVDGGTSRFDENGVIYQAVCAACSGGTFRTTPGYTNYASTQCNLGTIKFDMELPSTNVEVDAYPRATGCTPLTVNFFADTVSVSSVTWDFGDGNASNLLYPVHTYMDTGIYEVTLIGIDSNSCNLADTATLSVVVRDDSLSAIFLDNAVIDCYNQSFSASATNYPTSQYYWDMGDGTFYYTDSVFHIYDTAGDYTIKLNIVDSTSCELEDSAQTTIHIPPLFNAEVQLTDTFGCIPLSVDFESTYTNFNSLEWNFGNGQTASNNVDTNITYSQVGNFQVQLIIIDSATCNISDTAYANIQTINDSTRANIALDSVYFDCDTMQLNTTSLNAGADSYTWIFGNGDFSTNANASTFYNAGDYNGMYMVTDNSNVCYPTDTAYFEMHLLPRFETAILASDTFGCIPLSVDFESTYTNFNSLEWNFGNGQTASNNLDTNITYSQVGNFQVQLIIIDSATCNISDTAYANIQTINDSTRANIALDSVYFDCDTMQLNATSLNAGADSYTWIFGNGDFSTNANASTFYNAGDYNGMYMVTDNSNVCYPTDTAYFEMHLLPRFETAILASDTFGCIPLSVDFESTYTNFNSLEWNFGNGQTASNNLDTNITYSQVGNFQVQLIIIDSATCNISDTAYANIQTINDSTRANIALDSVYFDCDTMQLNATSLNAGADSYTWIFGNGDFSTNANASTFYNAGDYNGMYMVTDNSNVCYPTDTAYFEMHLLPKLEGSFMVDTFGCLPFTSNFNAESNSDSATYFWNFGTGDFSNQEDTSYTYNNVAQYPVSVLITDSATCNIDTLLQTTVVVEEGQVYIDIQIDKTEFGCDSIQVHLQAFYVGGIHEWDMGNGDILYGTDLYYTYTQLGSYTIQYNINDATQDCKPTDTTYYEIEFYRIDAELSASDTSGCIPLEIDFENLTQGNNTYWWDNGLNNVSTSPTIPNFTYTAVGNYTFTLVATDTNSCNINDTATINITTNDDAVLANFDALVLSQCDSNLLIAVDNTSQMATNYFWDYETGTSTLEEIDTVQYNLPGTYTITLIATNENLCHPADTVSQQFTMLPNVKASFSATAGCQGKPIEINNTSEPNLEYAWNFGSNQFSNDFEPEHTYENAGNHTIQLIVTDSNSCNITAIAYQTVNVANYPNVYFTTDSNYYIYPDAVDFHNHTTQYEGFNWKFGDGEEDSITYSPTHNYETIDEFTPCLIAWNGNCMDTFCKEIEIDFIPLIGVPNAFSPNNDGVNDIIYVEGIGIVELKFLIYNRWGELVFEGNSQNEGWDGTYKGIAQEMEVYTYVVNAKLLDGTYPVLKGNITLLR